MGMEKPPIHSTTITGDGKPVTTFVHTNTNAFREVVQRLTGPSETKEGDQTTTKVVTATTATTKDVKRTTTKLHERRKCMKPKLEIVKPAVHYKNGTTCLSSPSSKSSGSSTSHLPSPTTPSTLFSQLTLFEDEKKVVPEINIEEEEKAIKERRFYLHPSPRSKPDGYSQPELLNLFPLASPKASETV